MTAAASTALNNGILALIFNNTDFANIGDAAGLQNSATAGSLYVSLHTADPGAGGSQTTNEVAYTGYARVAIARSAAGWTVTGSAVTNAAAITFPIGTGGTGTATHLAIGTAASGAGVVLYRFLLAPAIGCGDGVTPNIPAGDLDLAGSTTLAA